jgi:hypothetical protein
MLQHAQRLAQDLQDMAAELGPFIQEEHAIVGQRDLAGHRDVAAADQPRIREGMVGRATRADRDPRRTGPGAATRGRRVVAIASARVITGRMVVSRRASIDVPAPGGPSRRRFGSERPHPLRVRLRLRGS